MLGPWGHRRVARQMMRDIGGRGDLKAWGLMRWKLAAATPTAPATLRKRVGKLVKSQRMPKTIALTRRQSLVSLGRHHATDLGERRGAMGRSGQRRKRVALLRPASFQLSPRDRRSLTARRRRGRRVAAFGPRGDSGRATAVRRGRPVREGGRPTWESRR